MIIKAMMEDPRWVCTVLSMAGATAFYAVKRTIDGERKLVVDEDNRVYNNHVKSETTHNMLKMKSARSE